MPKGFKAGGRKPGTPNKATADLRAIAGQYTKEAVTELYRLATAAESETARVMAIKELLDRGHGKSPVAVSLEGSLDIGLHTWLTEARKAGEKGE